MGCMLKIVTGREGNMSSLNYGAMTEKCHESLKKWQRKEVVQQVILIIIP
jgi:hypothetical protein